MRLMRAVGNLVLTGEAMTDGCAAAADLLGGMASGRGYDG